MFLSKVQQNLSPPVPPLITDHILEKILPKTLPAVYIFSYTIVTNLKKLELNPLIQNSVQQEYLPELYLIIRLNLYGKPWEWGPRKILFNKFTSSAIKNIICTDKECFLCLIFLRI